MRIAIAGVPLDLVVADEALHRGIRERYAPFVSDGEADSTEQAFALRIAVDWSRAASGPPIAHAASERIRAEGGLDRASLRAEGFAAEFDWAERYGNAAIPGSLAFADLAVRAALGVALLRAGGALLHAAGVLRDGFAIAFAGPSGAGKTTIARLCSEMGLEILADEMLAFRRVGRASRLFGTPFWNGAPRSGPGGAVVFLQPASRHRVTHLSPVEALPLLLAAGGAPVDLPAVHVAFFAACSEVLRRIPAYRLEFTPDAGFWEALDERTEFSFFRPARRAAADGRLRPACAPRNGCGA